MDEREKIYSELKKTNIQITKQRKKIIEVHEGKHMTIQEIYNDLKKKGYHNLGTVYNNIDFLLEHKIVTQIFINGKKHYDLTIDDHSHTADSHIHVTCKVNNNIIEINDSRIFDQIKANEIFKDFNISKLQLVVEGTCSHYEKDTCKKDGACFIKRLNRAR